MGTTILLFLAACWLAYANGANDNMKGVATLLGGGIVGYRGALWWGTLTTFAGSLAALLLAGRLLAAFSGQGLVPDGLVGDPTFLLGAGAGAASVVMAATLLGLPISTTHALVGGIAGAGLGAAGAAALAWETLGRSFAFPLLVSPFLAVGGVAVLYPFFRRARLGLGVEHDSCLCVGPDPAREPVPAGGAWALRGSAGVGLVARVGALEECAGRYAGTLLGVSAQRVVDVLHYASAGAVSFARGLNDTPKIAALLLAGTGAVGRGGALAAVGLGMAVGALLQARRVGHTMSFRVTPMNSGQGFTANLVTAGVVIGASRLGLPVSTTHVSVGALFGLGAVTRGLFRDTFRRILLAWVVTLPAGALAAWGFYLLLS